MFFNKINIIFCKTTEKKLKKSYTTDLEAECYVYIEKSNFA